ncbi:MAG: hypothetical protein R2762_07625 [Bryobacteraceae bacterium]
MSRLLIAAIVLALGSLASAAPKTPTSAKHPETQQAAKHHRGKKHAQSGSAKTGTAEPQKQ